MATKNMDNFHLDITSRGREDFKHAFGLFCPNKTTGYRVDGNRLILYWAKSKNATPLPYAMDMGQVSEFAYGWLEQADFGPEPDHDGDNTRGWRIFTEECGRIGSEWETFAAVEPKWAMHGK